VRITYASGSNWLRPDRLSGANSATLRIDFLPDRVPGPGRYEATVTIDAGPLAGVRSFSVVFIVEPAGPAPVQGPVIQSVSHAATMDEERIVPGSLATVKGLRFSGNDVQVRLDGTAARVLFKSADQINFEVPAALGGKSTAEMIVVADGVSSAAKTVQLQAILPGIFPGGVLNADGQANSIARPAAIGSVIRILATGIPAQIVANATVRVHDWDNLKPEQAAAIPELPGVTYFDVLIPVGMPPITSDVVVCAPDSASTRVCSQAVKISMTE
jgi:uncharacterized protein (TIGR03437 family)